MALPPSGPLLLVVAGAVLLRLRTPLGKFLIAAGCISLYLFSTALVAKLLISPLERNFRPVQDKVAADAIVVLTNGVRDLSHLGLDPQPDAQSLERTAYGYKLYRRSKLSPVIVSGGRADPALPEISIGASLGRVMLALGVPRRDLIVEDESLNTDESALKVAEILGPTKKRVLLVTSAWHMGRSKKLYEKAGFTVVPAPTNWVGSPLTFGFYAWIPRAEHMEICSIALYEYFSTLWYKARGVI